MGERRGLFGRTSLLQACHLEPSVCASAPDGAGGPEATEPGRGYKCKCVPLSESTRRHAVHSRRYRLFFKREILRKVLLYPMCLVEMLKLQ